MNPITALLEKYSRFVVAGSASRRALAESIKELVGIDITERSIKIIGSVAYVEVSSTLKSAIFMRQADILKKTEDILGKKTFTGIR